MAISKRAKQEIQAGLEAIFSEVKVNVTGAEPNGSVETIGIVVQAIEKDQLKQLAELVGTVPNFFHIKRSGTGLSIKFY